MPVPDRYRSSFSHSTLQTIETHASRFRVGEPLFFRGAYTANVVENDRRTFAPIVVLDGRVHSARCTCTASLRPNDLCRHVAVLIAKLTKKEPVLPSEEFDQSVWKSVAFASFSEGREIHAGDADPREQLLRKYVLTDQEQELLKRGAGSTRLLFESSPWYRWGKSMFLRPSAEVRLEHADGAFTLRAGEQRIPLVAAAIEGVINTAPDLVRASGFEIVPESLTPSLRITLTKQRTLKFTPVLLGYGGVIYERTALPQFGKWFLSGNRFASLAPVPPLFAEKQKRDQALLFEIRAASGLPVDRETVIAEEEVFSFIERHRDELAQMAPELAPNAVRNANPVKLDGEVTFDFAPPHRELLEVRITFPEQIAAIDIAKARRDGRHVILSRADGEGSSAMHDGGSFGKPQDDNVLWIDVTDPQFAWTDDATFGPDGHVLVTKLELLRIRGSLRGTAVFRGDASCERVFRMFDEVQTDADAPALAPLGIDLYGYQQTGYHWLWLLQQNGFGALLCDDMGLGKTHQAIALIRALTHIDPTQSVLVVCPTSVLDHWKEKLARYVPGANVTLTSYGIVRRRIEQFRGRRFDLMVLDEMQTIKNADTATHHALRAIEKRIAVGLTGTPIENHEGELKALLEFVVPGYLPKHVEDRALLQRLVRPFVLRRTKQQVLTELPPKIVDKRFCELTSEQRALYRRVIESRAKPLRNLLRTGSHVSYVHVFAALNYLKQICNHPASLTCHPERSEGSSTQVEGPKVLRFAHDDMAGATSGKWETFVELLDECMNSGLKVVVFSQYLPMLALIERHLFHHDIGYASIKGATRERGEEIARFREDPNCRVFTASLRAGGLGIDLTSASVVIHYDRWWNQAREDQATDRVHRLGQNKGVQVIKLITRGTIEEKIDALIARKSELAGAIIKPDDPALVKQFSREELAELLDG